MNPGKGLFFLVFFQRREVHCNKLLGLLWSLCCEFAGIISYVV